MEQESSNQNPVKKPTKDTGLTGWEALGFAWELGYTMAIPLVALALGGRLLDRYLDTSPAFLLTGILISIVLSSILVGTKAMKLINQVSKE
ncbi:MAG: AtpZ/AtpI family protein [Patescibacteria group bacterium]|nr:AtpZ/AtpI family protein [Patescibacteria group bacterium]